MAQRIHYFRLGLFLFLGFALAVAGLIVLGAGRVFQEEVLVETYWDGSVQGITRGTPVKNRGVDIGRVSRIDFTRNIYNIPPNDSRFYTTGQYVYVLISIEDLSFVEASRLEVQSIFDRLVGDGFRAKLVPMGLTGTMYVEMDILNDIANRPPLPFDWEPHHFYVPSAPDDLSRFVESAQEVLSEVKQADIADFLKNLDELVVSVNSYVNGDLSKLTRNLSTATEDVPAMAKKIDGILSRVERIAGQAENMMSGDLAKTLQNIREGTDDVPELLAQSKGVAEELEKLLIELNDLSENEIGPLLSKANRAAEELPSTMREIRASVQSVNATLSTGRGEFSDIMGELRVIFQNLNQLSILAEEYPSYLILGEEPVSANPRKALSE